MRKGKTYPRYVDAQAYDRIPKNVWADIAASLAGRIAEAEPWSKATKDLLVEEWDCLHRAGIIPQRPLH